MGAKLDAAIAANRTVFQHSVMDAPVKGTKGRLGVELRALKWADGNVKIGGKLIKGPRDWRGAPLFTLTLEERATCWSGCQQYGNCYGSNMMWARRYNPNAALKTALVSDLAALAAAFVVFGIRLHVLGDFFSTAYVRWWGRQVVRYPGMRIWGYTHWRHAHPIGRAVEQLVQTSGGRVSILRSDPTEADDPLPKAWVVAHDSPVPVIGSVFCPNETGRAANCGECGLCMNSRTSVTFLDHSPEVVRLKRAQA